MSVLSDITICNEREKGNIVISPFDAKNLSNSSYDISLGKYYYVEEFIEGVVNPWNEEHIKRLWKGPFKAECREGFDKSDKVIIIPPKKTILAHTREFIGGVNNITTMMKTRSSIGRVSIAICKCAGWGDVGFFNRYTMEITNFSEQNTIGLIVGKRVGQIIFIRTDECYRTYNGKYQNKDDLESVIKEWKPEMMLPRLYLDN